MNFSDMWVVGCHVPYGKLLFNVVRISLFFRFLGLKPFTDQELHPREVGGLLSASFQWEKLPMTSQSNLTSPVSGSVPRLLGK